MYHAQRTAKITKPATGESFRNFAGTPQDFFTSFLVLLYYYLNSHLQIKASYSVGMKMLACFLNVF